MEKKKRTRQSKLNSRDKIEPLPLGILFANSLKKTEFQFINKLKIVKSNKAQREKYI